MNPLAAIGPLALAAVASVVWITASRRGLIRGYDHADLRQCLARRYRRDAGYSVLSIERDPRFDEAPFSSDAVSSSQVKVRI